MQSYRRFMGVPSGILRTLDLRWGFGWIKTDVDDDTAILAWLMSALEYARAQGRTKLVDYLETVADDMVFEVEIAARRTS
jgi:hypothetical protein